MEAAAKSFFSSSYFAVAGKSIAVYRKRLQIDIPAVGASQSPHKFGYKGKLPFHLLFTADTKVASQYWLSMMPVACPSNQLLPHAPAYPFRQLRTPRSHRPQRFPTQQIPQSASSPGPQSLFKYSEKPKTQG